MVNEAIQYQLLCSAVPPVRQCTADRPVHRFIDRTSTSWAWDFTNDGTVDSAEPSPSHIYGTAGTYTVNLTVTNAGGSDSEVKTDYITVSSPSPALLWGPYLTGTTQPARSST